HRGHRATPHQGTRSVSETDKKFHRHKFAARSKHIVSLPTGSISPECQRDSLAMCRTPPWTPTRAYALGPFWWNLAMDHCVKDSRRYRAGECPRHQTDQSIAAGKVRFPHVPSTWG